MLKNCIQWNRSLINSQLERSRGRVLGNYTASSNFFGHYSWNQAKDSQLIFKCLMSFGIDHPSTFLRW